MILKSTRIRTPAERATLNRANPLARGVRLAWSFGENANLLDAAGSGTQLLRTTRGTGASPILSGGPSGAGIRMTDSGGAGNLAYLSAPKTSYIANSFGTAGAAVFLINAKTLNARNVLLSCTDNPLNGVLVDFTSDPSIRAIIGTNYATATYTVPTNRDVAIGVSWANSNAQIYVDARYVGGGLVVAPVLTNATVLDLGARTDFGVDWGFDGIMYLAAVWDRSLTAAEHAAFSARPFELFAPVNRRIYFDLVSGGALSVTPSGIATAEAFGTARLDHGLTLTAIGSAEAFGAASLTVGQTISAAGAIGSAEAFGTARLDRGVALTGLASAEAFGTARLDFNLSATGITTAQAFGAAAVNLDAGQSITVTAIGSAEAFGTAGLVQSGVISTVAIASAEAFGTAQLDFRLVLAGAASAEAFGSTQVALDTSQTVSAVGDIATAEAFGTEQLDFSLLLTGVPSAGAFGATVVQGGTDTSPRGSVFLVGAGKVYRVT
jgi:hypothetical protein